MPLVLVTPPVGEPLTMSQLRQRVRIDFGNLEPAPDKPSVALGSPAAAGNVDNGAHRYAVAFVTPDGRTQLGTWSASVTVVDKTVNGRVALTNIPLGGAAVTARELYRTQAAGTTGFLLATLSDNTTTSYTDNVADASLGAGGSSENTTSDPDFLLLMSSARRKAESLCRRAFMTQTWDLVLDCFPPCEIVVPKPPLQSVSSITYVDGNGVSQTLNSSDYQVDTKSEPARITPAYGLVWPSTRAQMNAVTVRFLCGYGAAADVPAGIKNWIARRVKTEFDNPSSVVEGRLVAELPDSFIDGLLDEYRAPSFAWAV